MLSQKTRAALTATATLCAATITTCLLSFYHCATQQMSEEIDRINKSSKIHLVIIYSEDKEAQFTYNNYKNHIKEKFKTHATSAHMNDYKMVFLDDKKTKMEHFGEYITDYEFANTNPMEIQQGRFFSEIEHPHNNFVIIGKDVAQRIKKAQPQKKVTSLFINGRKHEILGIIANEDNKLLMSQDNINNIIITHINTVNQNLVIDDVTIISKSPSDYKKIHREMNAIMKKDFPKVRYQLVDSGETAKYLEDSIRKIQIVFCAFGCLSLMIAGINITNSMYAVITERQKEIGIRLAIGASSLQVKNLLMGEATINCVTSSLIGILFGEWITSKLIILLEWDYVWIDHTSILSFVLVNSVCLVSCYLPLLRINKINPIRAIQATT